MSDAGVDAGVDAGSPDGGQEAGVPIADSGPANGDTGPPTSPDAGESPRVDEGCSCAVGRRPTGVPFVAFIFMGLVVIWRGARRYIAR